MILKAKISNNQLQCNGWMPKSAFAMFQLNLSDDLVLFRGIPQNFNLELAFKHEI